MERVKQMAKKAFISKLNLDFLKSYILNKDEKSWNRCFNGSVSWGTLYRPSFTLPTWDLVQ
ncbi:Hypothetical predicted protein [Paramuricea clavata]|uniref:Uncharacterized protein n=1 Tax=Paramuricea clavata TaxID=317549 RepID=A0A6S7GT59_PARCT|nr:Hypothetical predicted protein [Paramuricea clavata]